MVVANFLGFCWIFLSTVLSLGICMLLQQTNSSVQIFVMGILMILLDLPWRVLVDAEPKTRRIFSSRSGGHMGFIPIWITGFVFVVGFILTGTV